MTKELKEFVRKKVFTEVGKPKDYCVVGCKWIFKHKIDPDGQVKLVGCSRLFLSRRY